MLKWIRWVLNINFFVLIYEESKRLITGRMIIHKVTEGLYQSSKFSEKDFLKLTLLRIDTIIDLEGGIDELPEMVSSSNYKYWPIKDEPELPDLNILLDIATWGAAKLGEGHTILTHCAKGHNRSGLINGRILTVIGISGDEAVKLIQSEVPGGLSNYVFREYLMGIK